MRVSPTQLGERAHLEWTCYYHSEAHDLFKGMPSFSVVVLNRG